MYRRETQTLQQAPLKQKKGLAREGPIGPGGQDVSPPLREKTTGLVGRHCNHKHTVAPVITSIQGIGHQAGR